MGSEVIESPKTTGDRVLALIRTKYPAYHPLLAIADIAHETEDDKIALDCHKTIAKYIQPELRSIEVKAEVMESRRVIVSLFDGEEVKPVEPEKPAIEAEAIRINELPKPTISVEFDPLWVATQEDADVVAA